MALANIAVLLARRGLRVLAVDWDLEAPGIENYFSCFKADVEKPGLLQMLVNFGSKSTVDYGNYVSHVNDGDHSIALLASGKSADTQYSAKLEEFNWGTFFRRGGGEFIESLRESWRAEYDVTLIDSRTGLSDSGGVCTIQLPDIVVAMFTANHQSLYGARDVMRLARRARHALEHERMQLSVVPLASRFANDFRESQQWLDRAVEAMDEFYRDWLPKWAAPRDVAERLKIPHVDYFSFGEKLAVVEQGTQDPQGMGFAYESVAGLLATDLAKAEEVLQLKRPADAAKTEKTVAVSTAETDKTVPKETYNFDLYVSYAHGPLLESWVRPFLKILQGYLNELCGRPVEIYMDYQELQSGSSWPGELTNALLKSKLLLAFVTPLYFSSSWALAEWRCFEQRERLLGEARLIFPTIVMGNMDHAPGWFKNRHWVDMREVAINQDYDSLQTRKQVQRLAESLADALKRPLPFLADAEVVSPKDVIDLNKQSSPPFPEKQEELSTTSHSLSPRSKSKFSKFKDKVKKVKTRKTRSNR